MVRFSVRYAVAFLVLLAVETVIALYVHDRFVRPYVGDLLAVPFVYCALMSVYAGRPLRVLAVVLVIACTVELAQLVHMVDRLHIESHALRVILGTQFEWADFLAYGAGALLVALVERARRVI